MTNDEYEDDEGMVMDVPVSPALKVVRQGDQQEDEEAIEWSEVQHLLYEQMWGPILDLPPTNDDFIWQKQWEDGVDVSAFNTHDFRREHGEFNRYGFALSRAKDEYRSAVWTLEMIMDRIRNPAKYQILKYVRQGIIDADMCEGDMRAAVVWTRRCREAREKITAIQRAMWRQAKP